MDGGIRVTPVDNYDGNVVSTPVEGWGKSTPGVVRYVLGIVNAVDDGVSGVFGVPGYYIQIVDSQVALNGGIVPNVSYSPTYLAKLGIDPTEIGLLYEPVYDALGNFVGIDPIGAASNVLDTTIEAANSFKADKADGGGGGGNSGGSSGGGGLHQGNKSGSGSDKGDSGTSGLGGLTGGGALDGGNGGGKGKGDTGGSSTGGSSGGSGDGSTSHIGGTNGDKGGSKKPIILDLDGDGVEVNASAQMSFDWDGDGFRESGNWAACNRNARRDFWRVAA